VNGSGKNSAQKKGYNRDADGEKMKRRGEVSETMVVQYSIAE